MGEGKSRRKNGGEKRRRRRKQKVNLPKIGRKRKGTNPGIGET